MYAFYSIGRGLCSWSYGSWIYNYLCNQCLSPLMLWVWILIRARCTTLCDKVCQWLVISLWFSSGLPVSSTNKTDCHDITEILLKVALNTIKKNCHWTAQKISSLECSNKFVSALTISETWGYPMLNSLFFLISSSILIGFFPDEISSCTFQADST